LAADVKLMGIIKTELQAVKDEYGDGRRTEILTETTELTVEDLLADEEMVVTITRSGYIKRTHVEAYRSQRRGGKGVTGMETRRRTSSRTSLSPRPTPICSSSPPSARSTGSRST